MAGKILVVEDDRFLLELVVSKLERSGYEVITASDGEEGFRKVREEKPDLVLLDLMLPSIDGFEVLARIKEDVSISQTPVIILSNLGQEEDIAKGFSLGAASYLVKVNFTPAEIAEKVRVTLIK